jgi:RNA 3'-terminal phosphate cyclase (ATP)
MVVQDVRDYLDSEVPVGHYLADQLLLPLALAGSGAYLTGPPSLHATTNMAVIEQFTQKPFTLKQLTPTTCRVELL